MYFFGVYWSEILCAHLYVQPIFLGMRDTCMNPDVDLTVSKIVFYEILIMLGINLITKQNCLQHSDTNSKLNT